MSEIKKGDLVMVKRTCCEGTAKESGGLVGIVRKIQPYNTPRWRCAYCDATGSDMNVVAFGGNRPSAPLSWLKKIDPPSIGEYDRVPVRMKEPKEVTV